MDVLKTMIGRVLTPVALPAFAAALTIAAAPPAAAQQLQAGPAEAAVEATADRGARDLVAGAQARLAFSLIEKISSGQVQQATVSPASLASALSLVSIGADPRLKAAIAKTLGFTDRPETVLPALEDVRATLVKGGDAFAYADRIVFGPSTPPAKDVQARLDASKVPYEIADLSDPEATAKIDAWVKEVTNGAIPEILGGPVSKTSFAALNALHFKSRWKTPFDPKLTANASFTGVDGKSADVAMMHLGKAVRAFQQVRQGERTFVAVDLPFVDERFSLVVATTKEKPAAAKDFAPVAAWLGGTGFKRQSGDLALPRFAAAGREELLPVLDKLGLKEARKAANALPGFGPDVALAQVIQRAMIEVDEDGAEAAAATAAIGTRMLEADEAIHMIVDKPFIFALRDKTTGVILVAGYIGQPPKGKMS
jgi:serpin B